jgi:hypothetical protein
VHSDIGFRIIGDYGSRSGRSRNFTNQDFLNNQRDKSRVMRGIIRYVIK